MENIDDIIKERLQERIKTVIQDYHSGNIRAEVERELQEKKKQEDIYKLAAQEGKSGLSNKLREFWLVFTFNGDYYTSLQKVGGQETYNAAKDKASNILFFLLLFIEVVLCYKFGWGLFAYAKEQYNTLLNSGVTDPSSVDLALAYAVLGVLPLGLFLLSLIISKKVGIYTSLPAFGWAIYLCFMAAAEFPKVSNFTIHLMFGILFGILCAGFLLMVNVFIISSIYKID